MSSKSCRSVQGRGIRFCCERNIRFLIVHEANELLLIFPDFGRQHVSIPPPPPEGKYSRNRMSRWTLTLSSETFFPRAEGLARCAVTVTAALSSHVEGLPRERERSWCVIERELPKVAELVQDSSFEIKIC